MEQNPIEIRYEQEKAQFIYTNGALQGIVNYELKENNVIDVYRTFVDPGLRGMGIAQALTMKVIEYAKEHNYKIWPSCSFTVSFFKRNRDYHYLLAEDVNLDNPGSCRLPSKT